MAELAKTYDPKKVEDTVYRRWEESGFFNPDQLPKRHHKPFTIIMPPPNANGALHIGHAVFVTLQDIMIRFQRMRGRKTLWLPGADHAGFETQVVFDKKLETQGQRRSDIPRRELYRQMMKFTLENKKVMEAQLRKLGASCDWSRERFTLDPDIVKIVTETFVKLYQDDFLYRGERIVNWCVKHQTTLSDLEVRYEERLDTLYYIKYGPLLLATVRPETKFGDTAVAVHPNDSRYKKYAGQEIEITTLLGPAKIKVIADTAVDPKFGTGVIKVTPAHDPADFEIGRRHNLAVRAVIGKDGRLNEKTGPYAGLKVAEARAKVAEDMEERGLLVKTEPNYRHNVAVCYKCGAVVEPLVMPQWFLKMKPLADKAIVAVQSGKIKIIPERYKKVYFHWLKNIRDWNISRQIVWGIRIPAYYDLTTYDNRDGGVYFKNGLFVKWRDSTSSGLGATYLGRIHPDGTLVEEASFAALYRFVQLRATTWQAIKEAATRIDIPAICKPIIETAGKEIPESAIQDPDVLDTWFSSGQWPFATLLAQSRSNAKFKMQNAKLPWTTNDFETFYPTDVMETGYDILFFWVARMIILGLYATGKVPFKTVYLHGLVRDKDRQKMSKSKGNVIDPLGVAELYGTDAVRMALTVGNLPGQDIVISEEKIRGYRNFANKLWNIHRFIMMHSDRNLTRLNLVRWPAADQKRRAELKTLVKQVTGDLKNFRFHHAAEALYHYAWHTFADKIIESAKPRLASKDRQEQGAAQSLLLEIHTTLLKLLHPFMPFISEALWDDLPGRRKRQLLMVERWPAP